MLKKLVKKEEFFLDKNNNPYGGLKRQIYVRVQYDDSYEWMYSCEMGFIPVFDRGKEELEKMYNSL